MALMCLPGVGDITVSGVLGRERERIEQASRLDRAFAAALGDERIAQGLQKSKTPWEELEERAEETIEAAYERDVAVLHPYLPQYPQRLLKARAHHPILYCYGNVDALNPDKAVAMMGDNNSENEECDALAHDVAKRLAERGYSVRGKVPGAYAFSVFLGALNGGGAPVAAVGVSPDNPQTEYGYEDLPTWVLGGGGAFVSTVAPGARWRAPFQKVMNDQLNLIVELSDGLIVVESNYSGHSMYATESALKAKIPLAAFGFEEGIEGDRAGAARFAASADRIRSGQAYPIRVLEDLEGFERLMGDYRAGTFDAPPFTPWKQAERGQSTLF